MNISGVLVRAYPMHINTVEQALTTIEGVEVHGSNSDGRMVVTIEQKTNRQPTDAITKIHDIPGVLSASMIYHQFENTE